MLTDFGMLVIGVVGKDDDAPAPPLPHGDAGLRQLREYWGHGSELARIGEETLVQAEVDRILSKPLRQCYVRAKVLAGNEPELGGQVLERVRDFAAGIVMRAVGDWLEEIAPWIFDELGDPYVCPGCYAFAGAPCAAGCPDGDDDQDDGVEDDDQEDDEC